MVSKGTKKGIITAGVCIGGFVAGMAVGHFAGPAVVEMVTVPSWAKENIERVIIVDIETNTILERRYLLSVPAGGNWDVGVLWGFFDQNGGLRTIAKCGLRITPSPQYTIGFYDLHWKSVEIYFDDILKATFPSYGIDYSWQMVGTKYTGVWWTP